MNKLKKRILALGMAIVMVLAMIPMLGSVAFADEVGPIDYTGTEVSFIKADGTAFGMWTPQEGSYAYLDGDKVVIHVVPKNKTVYAGFSWCSIDMISTDPEKQPAFDQPVNADGTIDLEVSKDQCGKAYPIAPIKKNYKEGWTTADQYYLAIPEEKNIDPKPEPEDYDEVIAIVHTNDVHGHIDIEPYVKGLADELKASGDFSLVLTVSGGDVYGGGEAVAGYFNGELIPQIQDQVYDVIVPGNNDFATKAAGNAFLTALYNHTKTICGNVQLKDATDVAKYAADYKPILDKADFASRYEGITLKEDGTLDYSALNLGTIAQGTSPWEPTATFTTTKGTKVGLFGLTTTGGQVATFADSQGSVVAAKELTASLINDGADVIIGVGHTGWMGEGSTAAADGNDTNSWVIANEVQDMDAFVDAHTHSIIGDGEGCYVGENEVLVNQAACFGADIGVMYLYVKDGEVVKKIATLLDEDDIQGITPDAAVQALVDEDNELMHSIARDPVANTPYFLSDARNKTWDPQGDPGGSVRGNETNLGDFVTDVFLKASSERLNEDLAFAYIPGFFLRSGIPAGDIDMLSIISVIGYTNTKLTAYDYTAEDILELVTDGLATVSPPRDAITFNQYSGLAITYYNENGVGTPVTISVGDTLIYDLYDGGIQVDSNWTVKGVACELTDSANPPSEGDPGIICKDGYAIRELMYDYLASHEEGVDYEFFPNEIAPDDRIVEVDPTPIVTELTITNKTNMFKAVTASYVTTGSKKELVMALSGTGYHELFKGTYEEAVANGDGTKDKGNDTWIHGYLNDDNKWEFRIPLEEGEAYIPLVAVSDSYYNKYLSGQNSLARAFYPRQAILDLDHDQLTTGDYEWTAALEVTNNVRMMKVADIAPLTTIGGPNSNNYKGTLDLIMGSKAYTKAYVGTYAEATAATTGIIELSDDQVFEIPVKWVEEYGKPETAVNLCNGEEFALSFFSDKNQVWYERLATVSEADGTVVLNPSVADYTALEAALETVPADLSIFTEESAEAVTKAVGPAEEAVSKKDKFKSQQAEVDALAEELVDAVSGLEQLDVFPGIPEDYTGLAKATNGRWYYLADGKVTGYTGVKKNENGWWYVHQGIVDFAYNGFARNENGWWYCENGQVTFTKTDAIEGIANTSALAEGVQGIWYVKNSGVTDVSGVLKGAKDWFFVQNGLVDPNFFGVEKNENGWWRIENGKVNFGFNGFAVNPNGWWYLENGKVIFSKNDIIKGTANTDPTEEGIPGWWLVRGGQVVKKTTVAKNANGWWFVRDGMVDFGYTGVQKNENGWWAIFKGQVNFGYNGFLNNENGWWYCENGKVTFSKNDILEGKANTDPEAEGIEGWWYIVNSKVTKDTIVAKNANGWWYVKDGMVDFTYNGVWNNAYGWWKITNGKVDFTYTGLATNIYGEWLVRNGKVDFNYTGYYQGKYIVNGKVQES